MSDDEARIPDPVDQARLVRDVMDGVGSKLTDGDDWHVVSMRWWDLWKDFTHFDDLALGPDEQRSPIKRTSSGITKGARPPEIDNSDLVVRPDSYRLQKGLGEHRDFVLVHGDAWELLLGWYGGGPALKRRVISVGSESSKELRVELYPYWLSVFKVDMGGMPQHDSKMDVTFSRSETLSEVRMHLCANMEIKDDTDSSVRLWHRSSLDVDQTDTEALEGWEYLSSATSTLEDLGVVDGASLLLEEPHAIAVKTSTTSGSYTTNKTTWPFFHRLRLDYKKQLFKDPADANVRLEVDDRIDASAETESKYSKTIQETWYAATIVEDDENRVLVQFHNMEKPKSRKISGASLIKCGEAGLVDPIIIGESYEALDSKQTWHPVEITAASTTTSGAYEGFVQDESITWPVVHASNVRIRSVLTEEATEALSKVFLRYSTDGCIEGGALRGLMSCATNEYVAEDSKRTTELLRKPYGDATGIRNEGFLEYWRTRLAASSGSGYWVTQELSRLFDRVGAQVETASEHEKLLSQGREWIERTSIRLAQYRSRSKPALNGTKDFRDFRIGDTLDVCLDGEWKQAFVREVSWDEMAILVQTRDPQGYTSGSASTFKAQSDWIPMESERLCEYQTKSLQGPEDESDPGPLLARSTSRAGVCIKAGACGLQNIGNTCFMNSILQCLSNTPALRFQFAGGPNEPPPFLGQICTSPLSLQGKLAREFSSVLRKMWSNDNTSIAPSQLKKLIAQKRPEFSGYQQHDAHELLSFLLDGLHEDVNRAPYPPPIIASEDLQGKPNDVVASKQWADHLARNNSTIVELFQFQMRSELECPVCGNVSITFDPIMYLSLPVPKPPHSISLTVLPLDFPTSPMSTINVVVPTTATFVDLEAAVWSQIGDALPAQLEKTRSAMQEGRASCFTFADVLSDRIYKMFEKNQMVSEIRPNDRVFAIEVQLVPGVPEEAHTLVPVVFRARKKSTYSCTFGEYTYDRCAPPRVIAATKEMTNAEVHAQLASITNAMLKAGNVAEPWQFVVVGKMDCYGAKSGTELVLDDAVFEIPELAGVDFLSEDTARLMKDGLPAISSAGSRAPGGTSLKECLEKNGEREQLSQADSAYCSKCKEHQCQFKKLSLWNLPEVLVIHFKRFGRDRIDGPLVKIDCPVDFPEELDLSAYMCRPEDRHPLFDLYAVSNHGGSTGGGHYTAHSIVTTTDDRSGTGTGEWFKFNDSIVDRSSAKDLDQQQAYILFYQRRRTTL